MRRASIALLLLAACGEVDEVSAVIEGGDEGLLDGRVIDAATLAPVPGARVIAAGGGPEVIAGADGRFTYPRGVADRLLLSGDGYLDQEVRVPPPGAVADLAMFPERSPTEEELAELGPHGTGNEGPDLGPLDLDALGEDGALTLSGSFRLPRTIKVGRTFTTSGGGCPPVRAVEEMPLEEYVKGVVYHEIGVFRWTTGGGDSAAMDAYKTLAVAARSYALYFYLADPRGAYTAHIRGRAVRYHINDTACHQRYGDGRHGPIDRAVEATRGEILVDRGGRSIQKYEYAASCGRRGTRPEHRNDLVPDRPGVVACAGSWCGHGTCAGHEGCVVRGICQWGSLERSKRGDGYRAILAHYQPELELAEPGASAPPPAPNPPPPAPPPNPASPSRAIVVDDEDAGRFRASGAWGTSSWADGKIGRRYRYRVAEPTSDLAEYKVHVPAAGRYEVFARVPGDGYGTRVPYVVEHRGGRDVVVRDIHATGASWVSLGTFAFDAGDAWSVGVSCWTSGSGYLIADAIKLEPR